MRIAYITKHKDRWECRIIDDLTDERLFMASVCSKQQALDFAEDMQAVVKEEVESD